MIAPNALLYPQPKGGRFQEREREGGDTDAKRERALTLSWPLSKDAYDQVNSDPGSHPRANFNSTNPNTHL